MGEEMRESLGAYLKRNREERGITLEQIEGVTKISIRYLLDIEEERFGNLPAPVFVLGFVKQYAQCVGIQPEDVVARFRLAVQQEARASQEESATQVPMVGKRAFWVLAAALCCLLVFWLLLSPGGKKEEERIRSIRLPRTTVEESKKAQLRDELKLGVDAPQPLPPAGGDGMLVGEGVTAPEQEGRNVSPPNGPVALTLQATRTTRLTVTVDDGEPEEKILQAGDQLSYEGQNRIRLEIGSGDGIRIFYDGKVLENLGREGEVVHITFPPPS